MHMHPPKNNEAKEQEAKNLKFAVRFIWQLPRGSAAMTTRGGGARLARVSAYFGYIVPNLLASQNCRAQYRQLTIDHGCSVISKARVLFRARSTGRCMGNNGKEARRQQGLYQRASTRSPLPGTTCSA